MAFYSFLLIMSVLPRSENPALNRAAETTSLNEEFLTRTHDLEMPPSLDGQPLPVYVGFFIESMGNIKETEMAYHLDVYFYQNWVDPRLAHNGSLKVISDKKSLNEIWLPDIYFANAKMARFQTITVPNFAVYIYTDGTVAYSARITMSLACNLRLQDYPLDSQICTVKLMSYSHLRDTMDVRWFSTAALQIDKSVKLAEFELSDLKADYCNGTYRFALTEENNNRYGEFSCLLAEVHLDRALGYHLVQTYIPTGMIVVISWISFWIDPQAVPARVSLSFTTLLTLATQGTGLRYALPPVSYAKAVDYWYGTCMLFLFAALIEFAAVNTLMRRARKLQEMITQAVPKMSTASRTISRKQSVITKETSAFGDVIEYLLVHKATLGNHYAKRAIKIDKFCRVIFPGVFALFLGFYSFYYSA